MRKLLLSLLFLIVASVVGYADEVTFTFSQLGYGNTDEVTKVTLSGSPVSLDFALGGNPNNNPPKYYTTGTGVRMYVGNTLTITVPTGVIIKSVDFTFHSTYSFSSPTITNGTYANNAITVSENSSSVILKSDKTVRVQTVKVTYENQSNLDDPELSFPKAEYEVALGAAFTAPTVTAPEGVIVKYASENTEVAEVDEVTGEVTLKNVEGEAEIVATSEANETYKAGTASYIIKVIDSRKDAGISFTAESVELMLEDEFVAPGFNNPNNLDVTFSVEGNAAIIEKDAVVLTGEAGTATVTATFAGNNEYKAATASYTIKVTDPNAAQSVTILFKDQNSYTAANKAQVWTSQNNEYQFNTVISYTGTNPAVVNTNDLRIYGSSSNEITINAPAGYMISKVSFSVDTKNSNSNYPKINGTVFNTEDTSIETSGDYHWYSAEFEQNVASFVLGVSTSSKHMRTNKAIFVLVPAPAATPTFGEIQPGEYESEVVVELNAEEGATIYYTTDGTTPSTKSEVYGDPITVSATTTIKAIAKVAGKPASAVLEGTFTINEEEIIDNAVKFDFTKPETLGYHNPESTTPDPFTGFVANKEMTVAGANVTIAVSEGAVENNLAPAAGATITIKSNGVYNGYSKPLNVNPIVKVVINGVAVHNVNYASHVLASEVSTAAATGDYTEVNDSNTKHTYTAPAGGVNEVTFSVADAAAIHNIRVATANQQTGVEGIEAENEAPARYYNLNGVEVNGENLLPGIYVKHQGGNASKVIVK